MAQKRPLAIALCRVSSLEQLKNSSLRHQRDNVLKAADRLGVTIPPDGIWEGQVSSKKGVNYNRKDLLEMFEYCKKHREVKYLIVQECDRFMRSPDEQTYWFVKFLQELDVLVYFADKPELSETTHIASLMRYLEGWRAGGSNEERITKSINGNTAALKEGRWPFCPKPGYKGGSRRGVPEVHPVMGPALRTVLKRLAAHTVTLPQALVELNKSEFMNGHSPYKLDKFRTLVSDSFYAGVVEINKQIKVRNLNGLHEPLISLEEHYELKRIVDGHAKNQAGPRKNGNPKYAGNNITICDNCLNKQYGRFVGFDHTNGKTDVVYEKYRCRSCGRYLTRDELHSGIKREFENNPITTEGVNDFLEAAEIVWKRKEAQAEQDAERISGEIADLQASIRNQVEAATDPANAAIKDEILAAIEAKKSKLEELETELGKITDKADGDMERFMRFAFDFVHDLADSFLDPDTSQENRLKCKQLVFPAGFYVDKNKKVYTPEKSELIRVIQSSNTNVVRVTGL